MSILVISWFIFWALKQCFWIPGVGDFSWKYCLSRLDPCTAFTSLSSNGRKVQIRLYGLPTYPKVAWQCTRKGKLFHLFLSLSITTLKVLWRLGSWILIIRHYKYIKRCVWMCPWRCFWSRVSDPCRCWAIDSLPSTARPVLFARGCCFETKMYMKLVRLVPRDPS